MANTITPAASTQVAPLRPGTLVRLPDGTLASATPNRVVGADWDGTYRTSQPNPHAPGGERIDTGWRREQLTELVRHFDAGAADCPVDLAGERSGGWYWLASDGTWDGPAPYGEAEAIDYARAVASGEGAVRS